MPHREILAACCVIHRRMLLWSGGTKDDSGVLKDDGGVVMEAAELEIVRRAYAKEVMAAAGAQDTRVEAAFATVHREDFLGPGPWPILRSFHGYVPTPSDDPIYLYTDDVVGIVPERDLNNGQPSLHARLIASAAPRAGDHVVHVGAGVGYYTAILAELSEASGVVTAIEYDAGLAARAGANLANWTNTRVMHGDGASLRFEPADVIYVNAGATRPTTSWLDGLKEGGRLLLPLTALPANDRGEIQRRGAVFRIERCRSEFLARWISSVAIFPCAGARDAKSEAALAEAFKIERWREVTQLYRRDDLPLERCWLRAPGWCLAYC
jgi:protein-L-isoaspartate(D-aspartate) O-methyltransferase